MEETTNVTTSGESEATSQDVVAESTVTEDVTTSEEATNIDTAETDSDSTETVEETETKTEPDWKNSYKELQSSFTRQSQELAELKKQLQDNQPRYVDEKGKVTPEYEQQYRRQIDTEEFQVYFNYSRYLDNDSRVEVERLLTEAEKVYNPVNKTAFNQKMLEVKNYFNSDIVEQIALNKRSRESEMQSEFDKRVMEHRQKKSQQVAEFVEQSNDLKALLYQDSENYSPETFSIVHQLFDYTGGNLDIAMTQKAIESIKALGVKEHLAQQKANAEKQKASVPTGQAVQVNTQPLTRDYAVNNYAEAVKKYGMDKVDEIIMKG